MKLKKLINTNYIGWILVIGAIIFLYLFYFFNYVPQQEKRLQKRSFRILKEYSKNMLGKYDYYRSHFENYGTYYTFIYNLESGTKEEIKHKKTQFKKNKNQFLGIYLLINDLEESVSALSDTFKHQTAFAYKGNNNQPAILFESPETDENINLSPVIDYWKQIAGDSLEFQNNVKYFSLPVTTLMEGLKFDRLLDNIVLFHDSAVIYNSNLDVVNDITNPKALADSMNVSQGGITEAIEVRGEKKRVMVLPLDFIGKRFYLAGIIPDSDFKKKTRVMNNQVLIIISGILLMVLIGMPVLKIIFIDPRDRINAKDSYSATFSMILGTGLLTLIAIGIINHQVAEKRLQKKRIGEISGILYDNIDSDLQLYTDFYSEITGKDTSCQFGLSRFTRNALKQNKNFTNIPDDSITPFPLNEIILMDSAGIVQKAVTRTGFSEVIPVDVSERFYFKNVLDTNRSWHMKEQQERFYIESIKSYNTGKQETAISFHLKNPVANKLSVLAITAVIPSLYHQVLPKDIEFAVINERGNVLFHSIRSKNLHENFLDECNLDPTLMNAINLRVEKNTAIDYNEKPWMAHIKPIKNTPLFLIALLDIQKTQNRNTRIFLFTFYFWAISFICVMTGILIIRYNRPQNQAIESNSWLLNWLVFQPTNSAKYKAFISVLVGTIICQAAGVFIIEKPIIMLLYQLIFIVYTGLISLILLGKDSTGVLKIYKRANLPAAFILFILSILILILLRLHFEWLFVFVLTTLILFSSLVIYQGKNKRYRYRKPVKKFNKLNITPNSVEKEKPDYDGETGKMEPQQAKTRHVYNICLFVWLLSLSVVPVINYYYSVQHQEKMLWRREQMSHMAKKNLLLAKEFKDMRKFSWFKRIQGNGLDGMKITFCDTCTVKDTFPENRFSGKIYSLLSDPVTKGDYQMNYLTNKSYHDEWSINNNELIYSSLGINGAIKVTADNLNRKNNNTNSPLIWLWLAGILLLVLCFIWRILCYVTEYVLFTKKINWTVPQTPSLKELITDRKYQRVLLQTFNEKKIRDEAAKIIASTLNPAKNEGMGELKVISAMDIIDGNYLMKSETEEKDQITWISDIDQCLQQVNNHDLLLQRLKSINQKHQGRIITVLPFDIEFIKEYYEDYLADNTMNAEEKIKIYSLKRSWEIIFKEYRKFYGFCLKEIRGSLDESESPSEMQPFYSYIWSCLCRNEKLILYDLVEDGFLNLKNKQLIFKLINKGLILPGQYLKIFSNGFSYFIDNTVKPEEVKDIESKITYKGMWRNIRYPIIIILIIITTFIFISQGYSMEKVMAIFAGILTLLATMFRLLEGNLFRQF